MTGTWNRKRERSERWQREDAAPRLAAEVPNLASLSLVLWDCTDETTQPGKKRTQHIIVERAAALFEVICASGRCEGGGYDITDVVLTALRGGQTGVEGTADCRGTVGQATCRCRLVYQVHATYKTA